MPEHMGVNGVDLGDLNIKASAVCLMIKSMPPMVTLPSPITCVILCTELSKISPNAPVN